MPLGSRGEALAGTAWPRRHGSVDVALIWMAGILLVFIPLAVTRYRRAV
jgi:hypothetical protein